MSEITRSLLDRIGTASTTPSSVHEDVSLLVHTCVQALRSRADAAAAAVSAVRTLSDLFTALHARTEPDAVVAAVGDDLLIGLLHALTRALLVTDASPPPPPPPAEDALERVAFGSLRLLLALLDAQLSRSQSPAYWSRQFFFECDFTPSLFAVLASARLARLRPLAVHVLAVLCWGVRPVERADENVADQLSATALHLRHVSDVAQLDLLTGCVDDALKRVLRFYVQHTQPISNEADENIFDRVAIYLAAPFAYLSGLPVEGFVPHTTDSLHHEVRDTAAALALLFALLKDNDAWCARLLAPHADAPASASPRLVRRLLLLCSYVFGDAQDERSLLYASVCAALLELVAARPALFARVSQDREPLLLFTLSSAHAAQPVEGAASLLAALAPLLHRARAGPLPLDTLTRATSALLAVLRAAREQRVAIQWTRFASLWRAALTLLQRLAPLRSSTDARHLCVLVLQLLNDAIAYGNMFLPSPADYDALFYELLLQRAALEDVFHAVDLSDHIEPERQALRAELVNLRIIVAHFQTLLMAFDDASGDDNLDASAVLRVIQRGMQSLKLRLRTQAPVDAEQQRRRERTLLQRFAHLALRDLQHDTQL